MNETFGIYSFVGQGVKLSSSYKKANLTIVAFACLDNRCLLIEQLSKEHRLDNQCNDEELLLTAYQLWGENCVVHLQGIFIFVIWDSHKQTIFCARDRMGVYPFFYHWNNKAFVFANSMASLVALQPSQLTANPQWTVDQLCSIWFDAEHTFYNEVKRLPPAHTLVVSNNGLSQRRYWDFDCHAETLLSSDQAYIEAAAELLASAVQRSLTPASKIGVELSGGLDSTTIAAIAHAECKRNPARQLSTYSHAAPLGMAGKRNFSDDERGNIDLVRQFVGIQSSSFFTNPPATVLPMIEKAIHLGGGVSHCSFATLSSGLLAMAAEQGLQTMLSGWGGDELVSSHMQTRRYLLRAGMWQQLWGELSDNGSESLQRTVYKMLALSRHELRLSSSPFKQKNHYPIQFNRRMKYFEDVLKASPELGEFVADVGWRERLAEWWEFKNIQPRSFREAQYQRVTQPWLTFRLEASAQMAASFGIEYRYPLLDVELMSFFLSLPMNQKRRDGCDRYLFRQCSIGLLPEEVRWSKKAAGHLYPWYINSLKNDLAQDVFPVANNASEEVRVARLIAQAKHLVSRDYIGID